MMKSNSIWQSGRFGRWFMRKPAGLVGVDVGTETLKVAEVILRQTGLRLKAVGVVDIPEQAVNDGRIVDEPLLAETLRNVLNSSGVTGKDAAAAIGGRSLFIREIAFPRMNRQELAEAVRWEIDRYLPGGPEQYCYDYAVLSPQPAQDRSTVLLTAAPRDQVYALAKLIRAVGMRHWFIDAEPLAVSRTLSAGENTVLVEVGSVSTRMTVFCQGNPVLHRMISLGGSHCIDNFRGRAQSVKLKAEINRLVHEIHLTWDFFRDQGFEREVQNTMFSGGAVLCGSFSARLGQMLEMEPLKLQNPLQQMMLAPALDSTAIAAMAPQLSVAVGLAKNGAFLHCD